MRAIVLEKFGGLDSLVYKEIPDPEPKAGHVVIEIKAFGINHAEMHMRRGEWAEAAKVIGIECVGLVKSCPGGEFPIGAKVAALMGGLGRTINGSYAEYTRVRASNVAPIESDLPWAELAAIPETYAVAWTCLFRNLEIARGQTLVIRGAASAFGQAALNMAVDAGVRSSQPRVVVSASPCWNSLAQSASKRKGRTFPSASLRPSSSMRC
jgi:NADPH:quinone reductase